MLQYQQQPSDALTSTPVMRLRDDPQPATPNPSSSQTTQQPTTRQSRKRKTPPTSAPAPPPLTQPHQHPQHPPGIHLGQMLPPPHALIPPGMGHPPMYQYAPPEYAQPPPPPQGEPSEQHLNGQDQDPSDESPKGGGRQLSQSKRAEQNRKAQRAFRERRDQRVKALESRSQLLDAALASADEANRRWEECRALVDQLRIENAALRAALSGQTQIGGSLAPGQILAGQPPQQPHQAQESRLEGEKLETPKE
ncbi:hypothetical protein JVT61DRAFT_7733 [Boletus reticuloceps]|uniref:BZIP domain-containing protein n=1 Tax=Boletus reticuloceps TaxID=495285 RepID=A0A8I3A5E7_9AGAM|nr:hypothetical protein JVT61DRAFT_7733 [Boletus reticuloceps]